MRKKVSVFTRYLLVLLGAALMCAPGRGAQIYLFPVAENALREIPPGTPPFLLNWGYGNVFYQSDAVDQTFLDFGLSPAVFPQGTKVSQATLTFFLQTQDLGVAQKPIDIFTFYGETNVAVTDWNKGTYFGSFGDVYGLQNWDLTALVQSALDAKERYLDLRISTTDPGISAFIDPNWRSPRLYLKVVTVDAQAPTIVCPEPLILECTNGAALGTVQADVADSNGFPVEVVWSVDGVAALTNEIPSGGSITESNVTFTGLFADGEHTVAISASNGRTLPASCSTTVTVSDTQPPQILDVSATPDILWPPNHRMVPVNVTVSAVDNCDSSPATAVITQVTCNQPLGRFDQSWMITGPLSVDLRAERWGNTDRIYTIYLDVTDSSGNKTTTSTTVIVPKSRSSIERFNGH